MVCYLASCGEVCVSGLGDRILYKPGVPNSLDVSSYEIRRAQSPSIRMQHTIMLLCRIIFLCHTFCNGKIESSIPGKTVVLNYGIVCGRDARYLIGKKSLWSRQCQCRAKACLLGKISTQQKQQKTADLCIQEKRW